MRAIVLAILAFLPAAPAGEEAQVKHVVIVSIDGLRPEFYLGDYDAPALKEIVREGAHAKGVEGVFPSVTYPSHTAMVTGVRPWKHGIPSNTRWTEERGAQKEWYWDAKDVKAKTLWQAAREKGLTTAITYWPCTVGAEVDWRVAEIWDVSDKETVKRLTAAATPGLLAELAFAIGIPDEGTLKDRAMVDLFITRAACYVFRKYRPGLHLIHLLNVDNQQHKDGRESEGVRRALKEQDENIARIRKAIDASGVGKETLLLVTGDHGFADVAEQFNPNGLLAKEGWVDVEKGGIKSWKALCHTSGGSAAVHVKEKEDVAKVAELFRKVSTRDGKKKYTVLERRELDDLGYNPDAALALAAEDSVAFAPGPLTGDFVVAKPAVRGTHGHLPSNEKLLTGFLAIGVGVKPGARVERMRLIDIAPTVSKILGLGMKGMEGAPLDGLFK